jgi:hypothetical protein
MKNIGKTKGTLIIDLPGTEMEVSKIKDGGFFAQSESELEVNIVPMLKEEDESVQFKAKDYSLSIELNDESRELFKKLAARTRVKHITPEQLSNLVKSNAEYAKPAKDYYFGPNPLNKDLFLPSKQYEILAEITKFVRRRETAFVFGIFCPKCHKATFKKSKKKANCEHCGYDLMEVQTNCPNPQCELVELEYGKTCPQCFKDANVDRYNNIGTDDLMKRTLYQKLSINRPFHFFTGLTRIVHTREGKPLNLQETRLIYGFDLALDIDAETLDVAAQDTRQVQACLGTLGVPYTVVFSGKKGFHVWITYENLLKHFNIRQMKSKDDYYTMEEVTNYLVETGKHIKELSNATHIDTVALSGERQLIRVPFTYHFGSGYIACPLEQHETSNFKPEKYSPENIQKMRIKDLLFERGLQ